MNRSTLHICFTLLLLAAAVPISIVQTTLAAKGDVTVESADPPSGEQDTVDLEVKITGKNFTNGAEAHFWVTGSEDDPGGITVHSTTFVNPRTLVSRISIAAAATEGGFDIEVYSNGRRGKGIDLFKVVQKGLGNDRTPPDAVGSLQVDSFNHFSVLLSWIASGDDGNLGTATEYQIRYLADAASIDESNWGSARYAAPYTEAFPTPEPPGTLQTYTVAILEPDTDYAFGIRVLDEVGNVSPIASTSVRTASVPPTAWTLAEVDSGGPQFAVNLGMALDSNGFPGIAYYSPSCQYCGGTLVKSILSFARWNGSSWELEVVDPSTKLSRIDFEFGPGDEPAISYDANYKTILLARRNGADWEMESLDRLPGGIGSPTALAFDDAGYPMIAYSRRGEDLVLARSNGSSWLIDTVESAVSAPYIELVLDPYGSPAVAYSYKLSGDGRIDTLKIAESDFVGWSAEIVPSGVPLDVAGVFPGIEYNPVTGDVALVDKAREAGSDSEEVRYLQRDTQGWVEEVVALDQNGYLNPRSPSLAFDSAGIPHVSFSDAYGFYFASRTGDAANPWVVEVVLTGVDPGNKATLKIGQTDAGEVAYIAFSTEGDLPNKLMLASKLLTPAP